MFYIPIFCIQYCSVMFSSSNALIHWFVALIIWVKEIFFFLIDTDSVREYITRGALAVVLSDAIFDKEAISQNNFNEIYQLAHFAALQGNEAVEQWDLLLSMNITWFCLC